MKVKRPLLKLVLSLSLISFLVLGQNWLTQVLAKVSPYLVRLPEALDFGVVFPEEKLLKNYEITFEGNKKTVIDFDFKEKKKVGKEYEETITITPGGSIKYRIYEDRKKLPEGYAGAGDPALTGYYRNLCPHINSSSTEEEGDSASASFMDLDDKSDTWQLDFLVPPIEGYVPQGEAGILTVPVAGDYGCNLTLDELAQTTTLKVDLPEDCVDFVSASPGGYSEDSGAGVLTWTFNDVYYDGDPETVTIKVKATHECDDATTKITYNDKSGKTEKSGSEDLEEEEEEGESLAAVSEVGPEGMVFGAVTGANQIYFILASLAMMATGFYLRRRTSPASSKEIA